MTSPARPEPEPEAATAAIRSDPDTSASSDTATTAATHGAPTGGPSGAGPSGGAATGTTTTPGRTRASDAERERTVARLHDAVGEGRLDLAEAEERTAAAYAARYRDELDPLLADLPGVGRLGGAESWSAIWESVVWRGRQAVWGPEAARPTPQHCRAAVGVLVGALVWVLLCAVAGAVVVAG
jgi:hypothetical protein